MRLVTFLDQPGELRTGAAAGEHVIDLTDASSRSETETSFFSGFER